MSINGLVGLPGHGKSYSALELFIIQAIKENRKIVTNIPLNIEALRGQYPDYDFDDYLRTVDLDYAKTAPGEYWSDVEQWPLSGLYILDELWRIWPAGLKASAVPKEQLAFIKEHRHRIDESGIEPDLVFVTQNLGDIAACVRDMVETTIICTKHTSIGAKNRFRRDYYQGAVKGFVGPKMAFIRSDQSKYQAEIYSLYQSHTKAVGKHTSIKNDGVMKATVFNGLGFKAGVGLLVFLVFVVVYGGSKTVDDVSKMTAPKKDKPRSATKTPAAVVQVPVVKKPVLSSTWRLSGVVDFGVRLALITDGQRTIRIDYSEYCSTKTEIECDYQGEIIARYTGSRESSRGVSDALMAGL